jgi:hypothetical protein
MLTIGKKVALLVLSANIFSTGVAGASIPSDTLVVGGIEYGASEEYVRSIYGTPREVETKYNPFYSGGKAVEWEYGNGFDITFVDGVVRRIEIGEPNGIKTKANISVGTDVNALFAAYGAPDAIQGDHYIYYVNGDQTIGFVFEIEHNKIDEIEMGTIDR